VSHVYTIIERLNDRMVDWTLDWSLSVARWRSSLLPDDVGPVQSLVKLQSSSKHKHLLSLSIPLSITCIMSRITGDFSYVFVHYWSLVIELV
jgi:hypothetical protein